MNPAKFSARESAARLGAVFSFVVLSCLAIQGDQESKIWKDCLPEDVQASILFYADHEEGTLFDWEFDRNPDTNGGGVFNTGADNEAIARTIKSNSFTGAFCAETTIHNAIKSQNGNRAVRLLRWTDKPWDQGGQFLPESAYYGVWMRLDHKYSIQNDASPSGGWWNVFQFKSNDKNGNSQPVWVLNVDNNQKTGDMRFYLYSDLNDPKSVSQSTPVSIPVGRWFHVEALYVQSSANEGSITIWQDGQLILTTNNVKTVLAGSAIWGIGNYTDHIAGGSKPGTGTIYFDDATISTKPTHDYVTDFLKLRR